MRKIFIFVICIFVGFSAFGAGENIPTSKSYVDSAVAQKQDKIPANNGAEQILMNTGTDGSVGTKDIYDSTGSYIEQTDALVTAEQFNTAVQNAIDSEFECVGWNPNDSTDCWFVRIRNVVERSVAPSGYTTLEYIESTGTQYIDTNIMTNAGIGLSTEVSLQLTTTSTAEQAIIGAGPEGRGYEVYFTGGTWIGAYHTSGQSANVRINYAPGVTYTIKTNMTANTITQDVNGEHNVYNGSLSFVGDRKLYLFNLLDGYAISAKVYYVKIYKNGSLVRDFVPARQDSDVLKRAGIEVVFLNDKQA